MPQRWKLLPVFGPCLTVFVVAQSSVIPPVVSASPVPRVLFQLPTKTPAITPPPPAAQSSPLRIEIQLSQRQATVYRGQTKVKTYPVAVGRPGWETPKGTFAVRQMIRNPTWIHPLNGAVIKAGDPENPLGRHWIGFWTNGKNWIGFHGTPNPKSVGTAASHGCIRMFNHHVEELFQQVQVGTPVIVK